MLTSVACLAMWRHWFNHMKNRNENIEETESLLYMTSFNADVKWCSALEVCVHRRTNKNPCSIEIQRLFAPFRMHEARLGLFNLFNQHPAQQIQKKSKNGIMSLHVMSPVIFCSFFLFFLLFFRVLIHRFHRGKRKIKTMRTLKISFKRLYLCLISCDFSPTQTHMYSRRMRGQTPSATTQSDPTWHSWHALCVCACVCKESVGTQEASILIVRAVNLRSRLNRRRAIHGIEHTRKAWYDSKFIQKILVECTIGSVHTRK